jgi:hypothetical protein
MKPATRLALYAALVALVALPAVSVNAVAKDHDSVWADRDDHRDDHDGYRVARGEDRGDRDDHDRGDKSYFSRLLNFFAEDSHDRGSTGRSTGTSSPGGHISGAPGPIAGAGLPILAVGYGAYWLIRRYRRKPN